MMDSSIADQTADGSLSIRDFDMAGLAPFSWAIYPDGASHALVTSVAASTVTATTSWAPSPIVFGPYQSVRVQKPAAAGITDWRNYQ